MRKRICLIGLLVATASLLAACQNWEGWETYAEPTVLDHDGMGRVTHYEASGGMRTPPEDDGKALPSTTSDWP